MPEQGRWAGRNPGKDVIRNEVWRTLEATGTAVGPAWSMIPNFVGADMAAWHLAQTPEWQRAKTVKTNPDAPQIPIRLRALYEGKIVFAPVPYLTRDFPYLRIDPRKMIEKGISFELAATSQGFVEHGDRIGFEDVDIIDFCVVGSVAVSRAGGRTGKGAGFADLETAIFRELGKLPDTTPVVTTVHSSQLVGDDVRRHRVPRLAARHGRDRARADPHRLHCGEADGRRLGPRAARPVRDHPFLARLRDRMTGLKAAQ